MKWKLLIVKNNFKKKYDFKKGLDWFKTNTPLEIETEEIKTSIPLKFQIMYNDTFRGATIDESVKEELRKIIPRNTHDCVVLLYGDRPPEVRVSTADIIPLYPETDFIEVAKLKDGGNAFNHELIHTLFHRLLRQGIMVEDPMDKVVVGDQTFHYYNNDNLNAKKSNRTIALERLAPHWDKLKQTQPTQPMYKYFKDSEIIGLKPELVILLDKAREIAGVPFIITSGFRTPAQNTTAGGASNSSHLRGYGCDLRVIEDSNRFKIMIALLKVGFNRIGIYQKHIHCDIDLSLPKNVIWYDSKLE